MQLRIGYGQSFNPMPQGPEHYLMAVQKRSGELLALRNASPDNWKRITPMIRLFQKSKNERIGHAAVKNWFRDISDSVGTRPFFLDSSNIAPSHRTTQRGLERPTLEAVHEFAMDACHSFVPVVVSGASRAAIDTAIAAARDGSNGLAIVYSPLAVIPTKDRSHDEQIAAIAEATTVSEEQIDLIINLGYLDPDIDVDVTWLAQILEDAAKRGEWRNLVLVGSSMPSALSCIEQGTVGTLFRKEWEVWDKLKRMGLTRPPSFGDFAIQSPAQAGKGGPSMRASVRYTTDNGTLISRGSGPFHEEGKIQYHELCRKLIERPEFKGPGFSWGDETIMKCANEQIDPGSQHLWRAAGTSHHLEVVTRALATAS
jgi:hypothetical protein